MDLVSFYRQMVTIRFFEERLLKLFDEGILSGTTHTYIGQEANAVSVIPHLEKGDIIFSNHRCHGHYITRFDDLTGILAELMGKESGICGGRGGSQHLHRENFYTSGVQGGFVPIAAGMALAEKIKKTGNIVTAFIGDGTLGEGVVYETFNHASLLKIPLLIVLENNRYAQTTPVSENLAGSMVNRARAFDISAGEIDSTDVRELSPRFQNLIARVRDEGRPHVEVIHTYRLRAHSKGDDYRSAEELAAFGKKDPLLVAESCLDAGVCKKIKIEAAVRMSRVEEQVRGQSDAQPVGLQL